MFPLQPIGSEWPLQMRVFLLPCGSMDLTLARGKQMLGAKAHLVVRIKGLHGKNLCFSR